MAPRTTAVFRALDFSSGGPAASPISRVPGRKVGILAAIRQLDSTRGPRRQALTRGRPTQSKVRLWLRAISLYLRQVEVFELDDLKAALKAGIIAGPMPWPARDDDVLQGHPDSVIQIHESSRALGHAGPAQSAEYPCQS